MTKTKESSLLQMLRSWDELAEAYVQLAHQASQRISIFTHDLDPRVMNQSAFIDEIKKLVTSNRTAKVRVLCMDSTFTAQDSQRFIEFARRLNSFIEIRAVAEDFRDREDAFMVVDRRAVIYRAHAGRPEGQIMLNAPGMASRYLTQFDHIWEYSVRERELSRLHI